MAWWPLPRSSFPKDFASSQWPGGLCRGAVFLGILPAASGLVASAAVRRGNGLGFCQDSTWFLSGLNLVFASSQWPGGLCRGPPRKWARPCETSVSYVFHHFSSVRIQSPDRVLTSGLHQDSIRTQSPDRVLTSGLYQDSIGTLSPDRVYGQPQIANRFDSEPGGQRFDSRCLLGFGDEFQPLTGAFNALTAGLRQDSVRPFGSGVDGWCWRVVLMGGLGGWC